MAGVVSAGSAVQSGSMQNRGHRIRRSRLTERRVPSQHLVQHASERPDIGALVDSFSPRLLRTHIRHSAEGHTGVGGVA
jgi:hypothetical protein